MAQQTKRIAPAPVRQPDPASGRPSRLSRYATAYAWAGVALGLAFPVGASFAELHGQQASLTLANLAFHHAHNPLLWIIDTAPLFLGALAWWAGRQRDAWVRLNLQLEEQVDQRTAALARSEALYRTLTESAPLAILIHRMDDILYLNPKAREMVATIGQDVEAARLSQFLHPDDLQLALARLATLHETGQRLPAATYRIAMADGSTEYVEAVSAGVTYDGSGAALTIARNITERVTADDALRQARREAEDAAIRMQAIANELEVRNTELDAALTAAQAATQAKGDFLAKVSHELRTPLNGILGMIGLLADTPLNEEQLEYARTVRQSAEALLYIINDILDFSRIEAGRMELTCSDFNLRSVVEGVTGLLRPQADEQGLALGAQIDDAVPLLLQGDPLRLRQVLINLVGNAIKFTETGSVRIAVNRSEESEEAVTLRFEVRDTGIGIPADQHDVLFESFTQLDSSTTHGQGGTGLGLAISRQLIQLLGGEIGVDSREGGGATFWFTVRLRRQPGTAPPESVSLAGRSALEVLVVDDNPVNRRVAANLLSQAGYRVDMASNGREAVELVTSSSYDAVLMDCQMPELDGYRATAEIRALEGPPALTPVIALTAGVSGQDHDECIAAGMNDVIAKPVVATELFAALDRQCTTRTTAAVRQDPVAVPAARPDDLQTAGGQQLPLDIEASIDWTGDYRFWHELLSAYLEETAARLDAIDEALQSGRPEIVQLEAHTIKGSSAEMLIEPMRALAQQLEKLARSGKLDSGTELLEDLRTEFARLRAHLRAHNEYPAG